MEDWTQKVKVAVEVCTFDRQSSQLPFFITSCTSDIHEIPTSNSQPADKTVHKECVSKQSNGGILGMRMSQHPKSYISPISPKI